MPFSDDTTYEDIEISIEEYREAEKNAEKEKAEKYGRAVAFAQKAHAGQTRDEGTPYIEHVQRVAMRVIEIEGKATDRAVSAVLHDVIEDTDYTYDDIKREFGSMVAEDVQTLTKVKGADVTGYLTEIAEYDDCFLSVIKMLDRIDNIRGLEQSPIPGKKDKYLKETEEILIPIFSSYHKNNIIYQQVLSELKREVREIKNK